MSAVELLAQAVLDGRVHVSMDVHTSVFGIPTGASFYIDVDPEDAEEDDE